MAPELGLDLSRYLGRDGNPRDYFLEVSYFGLGNFDSSEAANGPVIPFFGPFPTTYTSAELAGHEAIIDEFRGSLVSPFPQVGQEDVQQGLAPRRTHTRYRWPSMTPSINWYLQLVVEQLGMQYGRQGPRGQDQIVANPNGRWYRQCEAGFHYSYLFGLRAILLDENLDYTSLAHDYTFAQNQTTGLITSPPTSIDQITGRYTVCTQNCLLGLQVGITSEYRMSRWTFDVHGKAGPYLNLAQQESIIQTNLSPSTPATAPTPRRMSTSGGAP